MARFLKHTHCDNCGSSDAKALYDDGSSWCFSCKCFTRGLFRPGNATVLEQRRQNSRACPDDCSSHFSADALDWLSKTGINVETLIKHGVKYSPSRNQIVFTWKDTDVWQARNLNREARVRYFTSGNHENVLVLYYCGSSTSRCILTEDALSAIKCLVAECDTMPLLGSHLPTAKMKALKMLYKQVDVFLDEDKFADALKLSARLKTFGLESKVFLNKSDPKHIPYDELKEILNVPHSNAEILG